MLDLSASAGPNMLSSSFMAAWSQAADTFHDVVFCRRAGPEKAGKAGRAATVSKAWFECSTVLVALTTLCIINKYDLSVVVISLVAQGNHQYHQSCGCLLSFWLHYLLHYG